MSTKVLHIDSSIFSSSSVSNQLGSELVESLKAHLPEVQVRHRDLGAEALPHFDANTIAAIGKGEAKVADLLIQELLDADILILGVPMYNFSIPSQLKAWFDHVARAGTTFKYTDQGPVGLAGNKKVYVLATRGGQYQGTPADTQTGLITTFLGFLGMDDVQFIYAEGLNMGDETRDQAIDKAKAEIAEHVKQLVQSEEVA